MSDIPIKAAKDVANEYGLDMVVLVAYSKRTNLRHVVSYGRTKKDCTDAAQSAKWAKAALGFEGVEPEPCKHDWHCCPRCGKGPAHNPPGESTP